MREIFGFSHDIKIYLGGSIPKWSGLNALGSSRATSLTVFVPFIGSFILFNEKIYDSLKLIPQFSTASNDSLLHISLLQRVYLLYLGLSLIGIASFLFNLFCPSAIKRFRSYNEYIEAEEKIVSKPRLSVMVVDIARFYSKYAYKNGFGQSFWSAISFDPRISVVAYQTFTEIARRVGEKVEDLKTEGEEDGLFSYRGYLNMDKWMGIISGPPSAYRAIAEEVFETSQKNALDIIILHHMSENCYKPALRLGIAACFATGFILLIIPTIFTFIQIVNAIIK